MKKKWIGCVAIVLVTVLLLGFLQALVQPKYMSQSPEGALIAEYYNEKSAHDVIFIGDCEVYEGFTPPTLWEEYGNDVLSDNDKKEFDAFVGHKLSERKPVSATQTPNDYTEKFFDKDSGKYYDVESYYYGMLGDNYSDADEETLLDDWKKSVYIASSTDSDADEEGLAWWAWVLIAVGGVAVVVGGVFLGIYLRKRSKKAMEERMRSSKPRKKIDTTDDKTIDVYADDAAEEAPSEEAEEATEAAEETVEEVVEETAEETAE